MIDFCPEYTPLQTPVLTSFWLRNRIYVVDMEGVLFQIDVEGDDPDLWCWREVMQL
jgi:hypothetical protein